ncbi:hypothetical protein PORCRE_804 [Porphyromonas crevioricanis JCM 15906]|uniref:Uncharacterized protein n=1 Tax=Porphyromonas crevioricanis JCM 15906 TaxID=1305617 RepID=T1CH21_9PORP|nr:hypothetical protein PORCRE_804 [Porphyromonas crevioricanis JCM 15906]GAD07343.1 hypothetical protein PORCAN_963 [Porphyromonas crevioricanis JCM 13913]
MIHPLFFEIDLDEVILPYRGFLIVFNVTVFLLLRRKLR